MQQVLLDFRTAPPAGGGDTAHLAASSGAQFRGDHWVLRAGGEAVIGFCCSPGSPLGRVTLVGSPRHVARRPVEIRMEANGTLVWTREGLPSSRTRELERFDIPASVLRPGQNALTVRNCGPEDSVYRLYKVFFEPLT
ncbi:hypothetical protein [Umezawaea tangerina]|uniref:Uncharacterized protein n=1 Tax=Umezawaea tangerina TaxID=84725 RepID=A0A2T0SSA6_9PSEU|nr:hypothetical protein [Umezawaea tangerina]PRY36290.1 hypothetical protein CLV43_112217 [Umezawaea tangerina]